MKICPTCLRCYEESRSRCAEPGHRPLEPAPGPVRIAERYVLERVIGRGARATVFAARNLQFDRPVAIKILPRELLAGPEDAGRFRRAAAALAALEHPNVAAVYDSGVLPDGRAYVAMELVEGETLRQLLDYSGALPLGSAVEIGRQVADAISAAHNRGVVHGNLEPSDVLLSRELDRSIAKVAGFGLGLRAGGDGGPDAADDSTARPYAAPELREGTEPQPQTDVYGIGVLLYEMLAGRTPFETPASPTTGGTRAEPRPLAAVRPEVGEPLGWLVMQAIHANPIRRQTDGGEIAERLRVFEAEIASRGNAEEPASSPAAPSAIAPEPEKSAEPASAVEARSVLHSASVPLSPAAPQPPRASDAPPPERRGRSASSLEPEPPHGRARRVKRLVVYGALGGGLAVAAVLLWFNVQTSAVSAGARAKAAPRASGPADASTTRAAALPARPEPTPSIVSRAEISPPRPAEPTAPALAQGTESPGAAAASSPAAVVEAEPSASPVSTPRPVARAPAEPRAELTRALADWIAATNARDSRRFMRYYMPRVETFYLSRNVSSAFVRDEKRRVIGRARTVRIRAGALEIHMDPPQRNATLRFRKSYEIDSGRGMRRGEVIQEMRWVRTADGWKIASERDAKVIR